MKYDYSGIVQKKIQFDSVIIDNNEYVVPAIVANTLESLSNRLVDERNSHEATKMRVEEISADKYGVVAERIMFALEAGVNRDSLLNGSINDYDKVDPITCEPIFEFRNELHRRIVNALNGLTPEGKPYK